MIVIKNATLFCEGEEVIKDVLIKEQVIARIDDVIEESEAIMIEAKGLYLLPGIIDLNVRFKDNLLSQEHIERLKSKAQKSGVTTMALMPDFTPAIENDTFMELFASKVDASMKLSVKGLQVADESRLNNISRLLASGGRLIQENSHINGNLLRRILQYSLMKKIPFFVFCNNPDLNDNGVMHEGKVSAKLGLAGISKISEISEVAKVASMAAYYGATTLFQSLSTVASLDIIAREKQSHPSLYAEVSIFHLLFNDEACEDFNTLAKLMPPLRNKEEQSALLEALKMGKIDLLTSLHAAKSFNSKDVAFNDAAYGVDSLEEYLALSYTGLVKGGYIDMPRLIAMMSEVPAKILGVENRGKIEEGYSADMVLFDPSVRRVCDDKKSLLYGMEIYGEVKEIITA